MLSSTPLLASDLSDIHRIRQICLFQSSTSFNPDTGPVRKAEQAKRCNTCVSLSLPAYEQRFFCFAVSENLAFQYKIHAKWKCIASRDKFPSKPTRQLPHIFSSTGRKWRRLAVKKAHPLHLPPPPTPPVSLYSPGFCLKEPLKDTPCFLRWPPLLFSRIRMHAKHLNIATCKWWCPTLFWC